MRTSNTGVRNLYLNSNGYYVYKRPDTKRRFGLGRDRHAAITDAKELNERLMLSSIRVAKVLGKREQVTFAQHCEYVISKIWEPRVDLPPGPAAMSPSTLAGYKTRTKVLCKEFGELILSDDHFNRSTISPFLDAQKSRMKNSFRAVLSILFNEAKDRGLMSTNPATDKKKAIVSVERKRLSLDLFFAIREETPEWVKRAMDLALYLGSRVSDISNLRWKENVTINNGAVFLTYVPEKGKNKKKLVPIRARCEGPVLDILNRCRADVISEYVLHFPMRGGSFRRFIGKPLDSGYLSHQFSDARSRVFLSKPELFITEDENQYGKMRGMRPAEFPSWHEIRSLAGWLEEQIKENGGTSAQKMFGHATKEMTSLYFSRRPVEITDITIGSTAYT